MLQPSPTRPQLITVSGLPAILHAFSRFSLSAPLIRHLATEYAGVADPSRRKRAPHACTYTRQPSLSLSSRSSLSVKSGEKFSLEMVPYSDRIPPCPPSTFCGVQVIWPRARLFQTLPQHTRPFSILQGFAPGAATNSVDFFLGAEGFSSSMDLMIGVESPLGFHWNAGSYHLAALACLLTLVPCTLSRLTNTTEQQLQPKMYFFRFISRAKWKFDTNLNSPQFSVSPLFSLIQILVKHKRHPRKIL